METYTNIVSSIDSFLWGIPLITLILAGDLWLTFRLHGLQIRRLPLALKYMVRNETDGKGEISSFAALCTALSATIGTGNIVGVPAESGTGRFVCYSVYCYAGRDFPGNVFE